MKVWSKKHAMAVAQHIDNVSALIQPIISDAFSKVQNRLIDEIDQNLSELRLLLLRCPFVEDNTRLGVQQDIVSMLETLHTNMGALSKALKGERVVMADDKPQRQPQVPLILIDREKTLTLFYPNDEAIA